MAKETRRLMLGDTVVYFARPEPSADARARPATVTLIHGDEKTVDLAVILRSAGSFHHVDGVRSYSAIKDGLRPGASFDPTVCSSGVWIWPEEHRALIDAAVKAKADQVRQQQAQAQADQQQENFRRKIKELLSAGKTIEEVVLATGANMLLVEHLSQEIPRRFASV